MKHLQLAFLLLACAACAACAYEPPAAAEGTRACVRADSDSLARIAVTVTLDSTWAGEISVGY